MLRTLSSFEKYKTNIDDVGGKRRYSRNILKWSKNDFKSKNSTNGDYLLHRATQNQLNQIKLLFSGLEIDGHFSC